MKIKTGILALFICLDIEFLSRFSGYSIENKVFVIISFAVTAWLIWSIVKESQKNKLESIKRQEDVQALIDRINTGYIPKLERCSLILKNGEFACAEVRTYLVETKNKVVGSTGSGGGVSVRITRGVYVRSGTSGSKKIYKNITEKHLGNLVITNKRIVFLNDKKGFEVSYRSLIGLFPSAKNVLVVQTKSKSYTILLQEPVVYEMLIRALTQS